jgi:hypothetical protein
MYFKTKIHNVIILILSFIQPTLSSAQNEWYVPLNISSGDWQVTLYFGVHSDGSDAHDTGLDTLAPPPGFGPYAYFYIESFPNFLYADFRQPEHSEVWQLRTANCAGKILILQWDLSQFNAAADQSSALELLGYGKLTELDSAVIEGDISVQIALSISTRADKDVDNLDLRKNSTLITYPNPFKSDISIAVGIPRSGLASISVYDIRGRLVATIFNGNITAGHYEVDWSATDSIGNKMATGLYFCRLALEEQVHVSNMLLVR